MDKTLEDWLPTHIGTSQTTQNNHSYQFLGSDNFSEDVYIIDGQGHK